MMRTLLIISFLFIIKTVDAQTNDYFIVNSDTTFCTNLEYSLTAQSYLARITYTDINGKKVNIEGRKNVPDIVTLFIDGKTIDRIPQKTDKPDKYVKFAHRVVDGPLIVNYNNVMLSSTGATSNIVKFYVKMPDGTYYDINKKSDLKKYIIPYLQKCDAFKTKYTGDYSPKYEAFVETIELYNSLCK